jgi:thiol:disulfide interchange protein DsbD
MLVCGTVVLIGAVSGHIKVLNPVSAAYSAETQAALSSPSSLFTYVSTSSQLQEKIAEAKEAHKPVMIEFFATWCPYCKALDRNVLSDAEVRKSMKAFATLRVDISVNSQELSDMMDEYHVYGVPTLIFFDKDGSLYNADNLSDGITKSGLLTTLRKLS